MKSNSSASNEGDGANNRDPQGGDSWNGWGRKARPRRLGTLRVRRRGRSGLILCLIASID